MNFIHPFNNTGLKAGAKESSNITKCEDIRPREKYFAKRKEKHKITIHSNRAFSQSSRALLTKPGGFARETREI